MPVLTKGPCCTKYAHHRHHPPPCTQNVAPRSAAPHGPGACEKCGGQLNAHGGREALLPVTAERAWGVTAGGLGLIPALTAPGCVVWGKSWNLLGLVSSSVTQGQQFLLQRLNMSHTHRGE